MCQHAIRILQRLIVLTGVIVLRSAGLRPPRRVPIEEDRLYVQRLADYVLGR